MLSINTNLSSLIAQSSMKQSTNKLNQAIERMTTGFKINHAKDNAANYSISTNMTTKIGAYNVVEDNAAMGLDLINTAEGTLDQIQDKLQRLRALQEQASNGTYGAESLSAINAEVNALVDEINRLYSTAEYNGIKLFGGESTPVSTNTSLTRTTETITSVGFLNPVEHQDTSSAIAISSLAEDELLVAGATYSVSTTNELVKLSQMTQVDGTFGTFNIVLGADIDMSAVENWNGIRLEYEHGGMAYLNFDGNGYVISSLTSDTGLFRRGNSGLENGIIGVRNLGLENVNIVSLGDAGAIINTIDNFGAIEVYNCYVTGKIQGSNAGAFVGSIISYGDFPEDVEVNAFTLAQSNADIVGSLSAGGLIGSIEALGDEDGILEISEASYLGDSALDAVIVGDSCGFDVALDNITYNKIYDLAGLSLIAGSAQVTSTNISSVEVIKPAEPNDSTDPDADVGSDSSGNTSGSTTPGFTSAPDTIILQIGASSDWASQVGISTKFSLEGLENLRNIGLNTTTDYLTQIDDMLAVVSEKQTHFGAVSNRLESVLEEITIQRDNLVSSRSTIRDADIAEVSSTYIQQQILQQASATLLSIANQSPSIALQLI